MNRLQQRILHRVLIIGHVLEEDEARSPMIAAVNDLLDEITEAARTIGTILQQAGAGLIFDCCVSACAFELGGELV